MKKTLALVIMAAALLLTQCKKPSIEFPTPSVTTTVSMTITAGPGSKTDITTAGGIVWSANDKIYVGDGAKCIGCLSIVSGVGNATGTFTGDVTATTGGNRTFHFYYLGSTAAPDVDATEVTVNFSSQNIYNNGGKLENASGQHVGYGKVEGVDVEADTPITGIQVDMKSKVAIAYFCFESGTETPTPYAGALTLSGEHIYNKMTVRFNASDFYFTPVKDGNISLNNTTTHLKYAMLVPTGSTAEEILNFGGDVTGATALENGIEANKFYRIDDSMPIVVTVKPIEFTVDANGTKVKFSPGNLQYLGQAEEGHKWRFAEHQWDYMGDGPNTTTGKKGNVDLGDEYAGKYNTGSGNAGGSETKADSVAARDLFGWGATGFQDTRSHAYQKNYKPYSTSTASVSGGTGINDYGYGPDYYSASKYNLTVENKSDWGCLKIGDDPAKTWRTLTSAEWVYLLNTRSGQFAPEIGSSTDCRYAEVKVNGVSGMMIFPDEFAWPSSVKEMPKTYNTYSSDYNGVNYGVGAGSDFEALEGAGVVFLPAAGGRYGTILGDGTYGGYWSSSCSSSSAYRMGFTLDYVNPQRINTRCNGFSVRLVR